MIGILINVCLNLANINLALKIKKPNSKFNFVKILDLANFSQDFT